MEIAAPLQTKSLEWQLQVNKQTHLQLPRPIQWPEKPQVPTPRLTNPAAVRPSAPGRPLQQRSGQSLQRHRSAPVLARSGTGSSVTPSPKRVAPELKLAAPRFTPWLGPPETPPENRVLPEKYETALLSDQMRAALIEHARQEREELVIFVEMNPARGRVGSLKQDESVYQTHFNKLKQTVDAAVRSHRHPNDCYLSAKVVQLPETWGNTDRSGPAFFDFRQTNHQAPIASNLHRIGVAPSRIGAYEVYMVWKPANEAPAEVEQLFSKLFSRCWPRVDAVLRRLRSKAYIEAELQLREGRYVLRTSTLFEDKERIRATINDHRMRTDWPELARTNEAKNTIAFLAEWDDRDAANKADPELREAIEFCHADGINLEEALSQLETAVELHLPHAREALANEARELLTGLCDVALRELLASGGREVYERTRHRIELCSVEVAGAVRTKLEVVQQHEEQLKNAMASGEAAAIVEALKVMEQQWSPEVVKESFKSLKPLLAADAAMRGAMATGKKTALKEAAAEHLASCSPSIAEEAKRSMLSVSDRALKSVLKTGDKAALEQTAVGVEKHLETCSVEVGAAVKSKREEIERTEAELHRALDSGEASMIQAALQLVDAKFSPDEVEEARRRLKPLLDSDAKLKEAIQQGDVFSAKTKQQLSTASRSVAQEVRWKAVDVADQALRSVMVTGDKAALERTCKAYLGACSPAVAHAAERQLELTEAMLATLQRAVSSGEASEMSAALQQPQVQVWVPQLVKAVQSKLRKTLRADAELTKAMDRGDTTYVLESTDGNKASKSACSPSVIEEIRFQIISNADGELYALLKTGDKAALEEAAKHRLSVCSKFCRDDVKHQLGHVKKMEARLRKAIRTREAHKIKVAIFDCDRKWSPQPIAKAEAAMAKILEADSMITASRTASTDPLWVIRKMTEAVEMWEHQASPSVIEQAEKDIEAMKLAPSKAMTTALKLGKTLNAGLGKLVELVKRKSGVDNDDDG